MARYIDAEEFEYVILNEDIEVAEHKCKDYESYISGANQFRNQMKNAIRKQLTADVAEVKHGKWIAHCHEYKNAFEAVMIEDSFECSRCGFMKRNKYPYCPYCGAKMDGGKAE